MSDVQSIVVPNKYNNDFPHTLIFKSSILTISSIFLGSSLFGSRLYFKPLHPPPSILNNIYFDLDDFWALLKCS